MGTHLRKWGIIFVNGEQILKTNFDLNGTPYESKRAITSCLVKLYASVALGYPCDGESGSSSSSLKLRVLVAIETYHVGTMLFSTSRGIIVGCEASERLRPGRPAKI